MKKERYYVSIASGEILPNKGWSHTPFEIWANSLELTELRDLYAEADEWNMEMWVDIHFPFRQDEGEMHLREYDQVMLAIYRKIYDLGSEQTRAHIMAMGILENNKT